MFQELSRCTLSKAFLKSTKLINRGLFYSTHCSIILRRINIWSIQLLPVQNPACSFLSTFSTSPFILSMMILHNTFPGTDNSNTPLQLSQTSKLPFFGNLTITPLCQSTGITSLFQILLNTWWSKLAVVCMCTLRTSHFWVSLSSLKSPPYWVLPRLYQAAPLPWSHQVHSVELVCWALPQSAAFTSPVGLLQLFILTPSFNLTGMLFLNLLLIICLVITYNVSCFPLWSAHSAYLANLSTYPLWSDLKPYLTSLSIFLYSFLKPSLICSDLAALSFLFSLLRSWILCQLSLEICWSSPSFVILGFSDLFHPHLFWTPARTPPHLQGQQAAEIYFLARDKVPVLFSGLLAYISHILASSHGHEPAYIVPSLPTSALL